MLSFAINYSFVIAPLIKTILYLTDNIPIKTAQFEIEIGKAFSTDGLI